MPNMNGLEVLRLIREEPELDQLWIMMVTGEKDSAEVSEIKRQGLAEVFFKPLDRNRFQEAVGRHLSAVRPGARPDPGRV